MDNSSYDVHYTFSYDAGYYGYIFSECMAADVFSEFEALTRRDKCIIDAKLGSKYKIEILAKCATRGGDEMLNSFLGRVPSKKAFFDRVTKHCMSKQ